MSTFHVNDFVVLGRTVPEESRKYGRRVCMAGYSKECNQFVRVYPLLVPAGANWNANGFRARHQYEMSLRRNPNDSRAESWRVADEHAPTATPWCAAPEVKKADVVGWLSRHVVENLWHLNQCRMSLGVLHLEAGEWDGQLVPRDEANADRDTPGLFDALDDDPEEVNARVISHAPYIRFWDGHSDHRLQVREWGAYRLLSDPKYAADPAALWSAPGYRHDRSLLAVMGNMCNRRNNWLIIKTFEIDPQPAEAPSLLSVLDEA